MTNRAKFFLLLLFVLGLLFVIALNISAAHPDDYTFQEPGWLTNAGKLLASPRPLALSDLTPSTASCLQKGKLIIAAGTTCVFAIRQSSFTQRVVSLRFVRGSSANIQLSNQEGILPVRQTLSGVGASTGSDLKVFPGKAHGQLSITCVNAGEGFTTCLLAPT